MIFDDLREIQSQYGYLPAEQTASAFQTHAEPRSFAFTASPIFIRTFISRRPPKVQDDGLLRHVVPSCAAPTI